MSAFGGKADISFRRFATRNQSDVMLSSLMILPHFSASARVNFASWSGLDFATSTAMSSICFFTSGRNRMRPISLLSRVMISPKKACWAIGRVPNSHLEAGDGFGHRRDLRQEWGTFAFSNGQQAQFAGFDMF